METETKQMALARIARNGLRRSEGARGIVASARDAPYEEASACGNIGAGGSNLSYLLSIRTQAYMRPQSRGIWTTPPRFAQAQRVEESDSECETHRYFMKWWL